MKLRKNSVFRILRGGSYFSDSWFLRIAVQFRYRAEDRFKDKGFRFVIRQGQP